MLVAALGAPTAAQSVDPPPRLLPVEPPEDARPYRPVLEESEAPWGLEPQRLAALVASSERYRELTLRFTCDESVSNAKYDAGGTANAENTKRYAYAVVRGGGAGLVEERRALARDGSVRSGPIDAEPSRDEGRFPPPFEWTLLFSRANAPYFAFRDAGERLDGFDLVRAIEFRGSRPFTDGTDVREWEGVVFVDVVSGAPLRIVAEPLGQQARTRETFLRYLRSFRFSFFGILNFRTKPRPRGVRIEIAFHELHEGLRFASRIRHELFQMVAVDRIVLVRTSLRTYDAYRFTHIDTEDSLDP